MVKKQKAENRNGCKTEKPDILSAKTAKLISKMTNTLELKTPMPPSKRVESTITIIYFFFIY